MRLLLCFTQTFVFCTNFCNNKKKVRPLEAADLPEVVICLDPGLNYTALIKYGYHGGSSYPIGAHEYMFVGWNGGEGESKSSKEILEETLLVPDFNKTKLIEWAGYSENSVDFTRSEIKPSTSVPKSPAIFGGKLAQC